MAGTQSNTLARTYDALSGRNRIINGACTVVQRVNATISTANVNSYAGPDRYRAIIGNSAGGSFTQSSSTLVFGGVTKNCITQTVATAIASTTTTNYWAGISQLIEGFNCTDLVGQNISISFIFNTNVAGTYSVALSDSISAYSYVNTFTVAANTPTYVAFNLPTTPGGATVPSSTGVGMVLSIGAINTGTYASTVGNTGIWSQNNYLTASTQTNWGLTIGNFISVTELQLEHGNIATPFERESYALSVAKCQRYYYSVTSYWLGYTLNASACTGAVIFPVSLRGSPSLVAGATFAASSGSNGTPAGFDATSQYYTFVNTGANWTTTVSIVVNASFTAEY